VQDPQGLAAVTTRLADGQDLPTLAALRRCWSEGQAGCPLYDDSFEERFTHWYLTEAARRVTFLAEIDGTVVGMINLVQHRVNPSGVDPGVAAVADATVARNLGVCERHAPAHRNPDRHLRTSRSAAPAAATTTTRPHGRTNPEGLTRCCTDLRTDAEARTAGLTLGLPQQGVRAGSAPKSASVPLCSTRSLPTPTTEDAHGSCCRRAIALRALLPESRIRTGHHAARAGPRHLTLAAQRRTTPDTVRAQKPGVGE